MAAGFVGLLVSNRSIARKNVEIERSRDEAVQARRRADRERDEARMQKERARRAVDEMYTQVAEKWLKDQPRLDGLRREFLEKALAFYQSFSLEQGSDPTVRFETAQAFQRVGDIERKLGRSPASEAAYVRANGLLEALAHDYPDEPRYRGAFAHCQMTLGFILEPDRPSLAEKNHRRAVELSENLAKELPGERIYWSNLALRYNNLANAVMRLGRYREAESLYRTCRDLCEELTGKFPGKVVFRYGIAIAQGSLAELLDAAGRAGPAAASYRRDLSLWDGLTRDDPENAEYRHVKSHVSAEYGNLLVAMGKIHEAEVVLETARTVVTKLIEEHPDVPDYKEDLQLCYIGLGRMSTVLGKSREAESSFLKALSIREQLDAQDATRMGGGGRDAALIRRTLGDLLRSRGDTEGAASYYRRSLEGLKAIAVKEADSPLDWHNLAWFLVTCPDPGFRDPPRAISWAERAVKHSPGGRFWTTLGVARYRNGDWKGSIADLERSMALNNGGTATDWFFLAMAHHRLGDDRQARKWLDQAVAWTKENKPKDVELAMFRGEAEALLAGVGPRS